MYNLPAYTPDADNGRPFRAVGEHQRCLNGHQLDRAGVNCGFDHTFWLSDVSCKLCLELRLPRATWDEVDHLRLGDEAPPTHSKLLLSARRPGVKGGIGQIVAELRGKVIGDLDLRMCGVDGRGVVEQVRVDEQYRMRGLGTVLVSAALARAPDFRWSTTVVDASVEARSFWAVFSTPVRLELGEPHYCSHMREADGEFV